MDISYNWLKRYIDVDMEPRQLAATLTSLGLECDTVEEVESIRGGLRGLVTAKVLTCIDHPDSDHLHITTVDTGDGVPVQIVCGAPNVAAGQTVIVAPVGCTLYDGDKEFKIKKSKMRGAESLGMICAEDEIGVGSSHDGIMVLPDSVPAGMPAASYFNLESDWRLEVELTPNRVDAASHYGTARDLKAWYACRDFETGGTRIPEVSLPDVSSLSPDRADGATPVTVLDTEGCPRYSGVTIRGVRVAESPQWLRDLLTAAGQRPINNIVDITNFVLLGLGQPLHCFDLDKVRGGSITVRTCPAGTEFTTLDGVQHKLDESDLMICDADKPLCIAGVFGGLDSGVTEQTRDVFIESAYFNPTRVRRTARRHGLSTDASFRYERGTDPNITVYAAKLAAKLIKELAGGEMCGPVSDFYPSPVPDAEMDFSLRYCAGLIGKELPRDLVITILRALEIDVRPTDDDDVLHLRVPAYRVDVTRPCDVVEEILRVYGYNNVEFGTEMHANLSQRGHADYLHAMQTLISDQLTGQGFSEIMNNSLSSARYYPAEGSPLSADRCVTLLNPLSGDLSVMRQTLLFGGLETISHNVRRKASDLRLYEFGNTYSRDPQAEATEERPLTPYSERFMLGLWMTGNATAASWNTKAAEVTFYDLRAVADNVMARLGVPQNILTSRQESDALMGAMLVLADRDGNEAGRLGIVSPKLLKQFDIEQPVVYAQFDFDRLCRLASRTKVTFTDLPRTQPVRRDLALLVDRTLPFADIERTVRKAAGKLLRSVSLFDVYEGDKLPEGKKSYAVALTLQDPESTLTDKQIDGVMRKVTEALSRTLGAQLR